MSIAVNRFILMILLAICFHVAPLGAPASAQDAPTDSAMALKGGEEGTVFRSLTIEGEDRVRIEFDRPALVLDIDPAQAPGLDWDNTWEVLGRCDIDFLSPLIKLSAYDHSPYLARPWFDEFVAGDVVRFRPALKDVDRWKMTIADSRSQTVAVFEGEGVPPKELGWNGRSLEGEPMPPGLTYSYVMEAYDRAGNKRNFVGKGFELPPYQIESKEGLVFLFSEGELGFTSSNRYAKRETAPAILYNVASRLNQFASDRAIRIEATARTYDEANNLARTVVQVLEPLLLGDPSLIRQSTEVQADAPAGGTVAIYVSR